MPPVNETNGQCGETPTPAMRMPRGRDYWRSVEDLGDSPEFRRWMQREFQDGASEVESPEDRRAFIKLMGASMALAGLGLAGCRRWPETNVVPYAGAPKGRVPGQAIEYATSMSHRGQGVGLLARSYDGRPIKLDGNPIHPSGGGSSAITQARILELYDPDRSREVLKDGHRSEMPLFDAWLSSSIPSWKANRGAGLAFLSETLPGPTAEAMRAKVLAAYPAARWFEYEPANDDSVREGMTQGFGAALTALPDLAKAKVVVALDADFLGASPTEGAATRGFAESRRITDSNAAHQEMSRLYALDVGLTLTGMVADERIPSRAADIAPLAARLALALGAVPADARAAVEALAAKAPAFEGADKARWEHAVEDLKQAGRNGIVLAGERQGAIVHALAALTNSALGAVGTTVTYRAGAAGASSAKAMAGLCAALEAGQVSTLIIVGGNAAFDAPAECDFAKAVAKAGETARLSYRVDETSKACGKGWHIPRAHFLEAWGDTRAADGTIAITQPLIEPMVPAGHGGLSEIEFLSRVLGDSTAGMDIVRSAHEQRSGLSGTAFELAWRTALDSGSWQGTAVAGTPLPPVRGAAVAALAKSAAETAADGFEVGFLFDGKVDDGRYGNLAWLQELPDPVTKITWDNALLLSPADGERMGIASGDRIRVEAGSRSIDAAAWLLPGHSEGTASIALGYGRGADAGRVADGAGFNAYPLRTACAGWVGGAKLTRTGESYEFARTQDHGAADALRPSVPYSGIQERLPTLLREGTLEEYRSNPAFAKGRVHVPHRLSLWEESNLDGAKFRWAMAIDLNACTGCSACVTACQAENNIPVVGKSQVIRGREMFWIRVDRYFKGSDPGRPSGYAVQPVTCMQCENAPCEQVCPVAATTHDDDGLNMMVYNRCIGTRYCSNNCPYKVRRFNFFDWHRREMDREEGFLKTQPDYYTREGPDMWLRMQFNPEVTVRMRGVMEKCTFCTQRIEAAKIRQKNEWARAGGTASGTADFTIPDGTIVTACQQACAAQAIVFGDLNDPTSRVSQLAKAGRSYQMLEELNTKARVRYMARVTNPALPAPSAGSHGAHG